MRGAVVVLVLSACGRVGFDPTADLDAGPLPVPPALRLSIGSSHTCAIVDGALFCWGANNAGQLGIGSLTDATTPTRVGTDRDWTAVCTAAEHSCGIRARELSCWGQNSQGEIGSGDDLGDVLVPYRIRDAEPWVDVACQDNHTCALRVDGAVWCWGANEAGELGLVGPTEERVPTQVDVGGDWTHLSVGNNWGSVLGPNGYKAWGSNEEGQFGNGLIGGRQYAPAPIDLGFVPVTFSSQQEHVCTTGDEGVVRCWGDNRAGQLGVGAPPADVPSPTVVPIEMPRVIETGGHSTCAILDGRLLCWGSNDRGELGVGDLTDRPAPTQVGTDTTWTDVAIGLEHACGVRGGAVYCWGNNNAGQLGLGAPSAPVTSPSTPLPF